MTQLDETVVNYRKPLPNPGSRRDATQVRLPKPTGIAPAQLPSTATQALAQQQSAPTDNLIAGSCVRYANALNPLMAAAQPLIDAMALLNRSLEEKPLADFRQTLARQIGQFEMECGQQGVDEDAILYARYVLCTVLDELVNKTPWSNKQEWNLHSLLSQFHGETGGGEKFFDLLDHLLLHPAAHLRVLELIFVCLNLGFEGKYHLVPRGHLQLEQVKDNLYQVIRLQRGDAEQSLSPGWHAAEGKRQRLVAYVPAWVILAVAALLLCAMFSGFHYLIAAQGDQVVQRITDFPSAPGVSAPPVGKGM